MRIMLKLFHRGVTVPKFTAEVKVQGKEKLDLADMKLLWELERFTNESRTTRCVVEIDE